MWNAAFKVRTVRLDGTVTLSHRIAFRSIAASVAVSLRRQADVVSATVEEA